jgi:cytochrome c peroxidase
MWRVLVAVMFVMSDGVGCHSTDGNDVPDLGPAPLPTPTAAHPDDINPRLLRRFRPLRQTDVGNAKQIALGKMLFFDPRLSKHHDVSCNTCHPLDRAGTDHRSTSIGTEKRLGKRNAPTVFNTAHHVAQFWDGRAADLEQQALGPLLAPDEMAMVEPHVVDHTMQHIPGYVVAFGEAFPGEPIDLPHVARALAAFERTLVTPTRWDRYLGGDRTALTRAELEGFKTFADLGCVQCHTGELVGGSMFQKVGLVEPWPDQADQGRYEVTHLDADRMMFKVPSLRNVALTAPYFHDGSVATLPAAITMMARHQLGIDVSPEENASIETWLKTLNGAPMQVAPPTLP